MKSGRRSVFERHPRITVLLFVVESYFIGGDVHRNAAGHRLVAQRVLETIQDAEQAEARLQ